MLLKIETKPTKNNDSFQFRAESGEKVSTMAGRNEPITTVKENKKYR